MRYIVFLIPLIFSVGCISTERLREAYANVEQCESEASTATGLYKAGVSQGHTWLEIKNDCLRKKMQAE